MPLLEGSMNQRHEDEERRNRQRPHRQTQRAREVYGEDQYGWVEYDEPRYVGALYRGERRGEEAYREHEWQRSKERPGPVIARVYAPGPKGYTRSDERIKEDISERLWRAKQIDSSEVTIAVKDGVVTFTGTVPERWMRHEIENVADSCMGVKDIEDNVRLLQPISEGQLETSEKRGPEGTGSSTARGAMTSTIHGGRVGSRNKPRRGKRP
jgi:osmotically-inducible protein OsmY